MSLRYKEVLAGLPNGLFNVVPPLPYDTEARRSSRRTGT